MPHIAAIYQPTVPETPVFYRYSSSPSRSIYRNSINASQSLAGRFIIVIALSIVSYLIYRFFCARNLVNLPPTLQCPHHSGLSSAPILQSKQVQKLSDSSNFQEKDFLYEGDLSMEKDEIKRRLEDPSLRELLAYIQPLDKTEIEKRLKNFLDEVILHNHGNRSSLEHRRVGLAALFVVLGIKPALTENIDIHRDLYQILKNLKMESLELKEVNKAFYFVNEKPLQAFDPRCFLQLDPNSSLMDAIIKFFPQRESCGSNQRLSYLLGYGPAWEPYAIHTYALYKEITPEPSQENCVFTNEHYQEIGKVFLREQAARGDQKQAIALGLDYHLHFALLHRQYDPHHRDSKSLSEYRNYIHSLPIHNGISLRTDYCRRGSSLRKWIIETYFSKKPSEV